MEESNIRYLERLERHRSRAESREAKQSVRPFDRSILEFVHEEAEI